MAKTLARGFRNVLLAGMPATGKSTFGRVYALHSGRQFLDFDAFVETVAGKSVAALFARDGEEGFRAFERKAIGLLEKKSRTVIALGGGTLCSEENFRALRALGLLVFVSSPLDVIAERLVLAREGDPQGRPLFSDCADDEAVFAKVSELWEARRAFYEACDVTVETAFSSIDNLALQVGVAELRLLSPEARSTDIPPSAFLVGSDQTGLQRRPGETSRATIQKEIFARLPAGGRPQRSAKSGRDEKPKQRDRSETDVPRAPRQEAEGFRAPRENRDNRAPLPEGVRLPRSEGARQEAVPRPVRLNREVRGPRAEGVRPEGTAVRPPREARNTVAPAQVRGPRPEGWRPPQRARENRPPREGGSPQENAPVRERENGKEGSGGEGEG